MTHAVAFTKMVGTGNDFLVVDARLATAGVRGLPWPRLTPAMCERRYGVGADGVLLLEPSRVADVRMRIFNADGSEAEMCGNGARCVARYLARPQAGPRNGRGSVAARQPLRLETQAGLITAMVNGDRVRMHMTDPADLRPQVTLTIDGRRISAAFVNTGVPHVVVPVADLDRVEVERLGRAIRLHQAFRPHGANVNFVARDPHHRHRLHIRTYERGVEGETLACGTGAVAAAVIHAIGQRGSRQHRIEVSTRSGETLAVSMMMAEPAEGTSPISNVMLEGAVRWICQGVFAWTGKG